MFTVSLTVNGDFWASTTAESLEEAVSEIQNYLIDTGEEDEVEVSVYVEKTLGVYQVNSRSNILKVIR